MAAAVLAAYLLSCLLPNGVWGAVNISPSCIQCLCESVSGGPACVLRGGTCHDGVCGPFAITLPYWQDAGRPTVGLDNRETSKTYESCALDSPCSEATIRGYMNKFHQDCNGDGVEDCEDFAQIHFHGGYECNKPLAIPARNTLRDCLERFSQPLPLVDSEGNDLIYPKTPTTFPSIDVRLKDADDNQTNAN